MVKMQKSIGVIVAAILCAAIAGNVSAEQTGSITLHVDTAGLPAAAGTPVSNGVPFPMGALATIDHLRLETLQGSAINANYWSLATWPDGSVKAALISFVPTPTTDTYPDVVLQYGPAITHAATGPLQVAQDASTITITTDLLKVQFSKTRFTIAEQAWSDLNSDGSFGNGEQWLSGPADLVVVDKKTSRIFRSSLWTSTDGYAPRLIEAGPQKVVILLEGRLKGVGGGLTIDGDTTLAQAKVWVTINAGSPVIQLQTTLVDTVARNSETFSSSIMDISSVVLEVPATLANANYAAGGESNTLYQGPVGSGAYIFQDAFVSFTTQFSYVFSYSGVGSGSKAPGWMDISEAGRGIGMGLRYFWQNFPSKLSAAGGVLRIEMVPSSSSNSFYTLFPGVGKTYSGFLDLHTGGFSTTVRRRSELLLAPALLRADASVYASSQAFGPLAVQSSASAYWDTKMENQYNCLANRIGCTTYPLPYGQRDFGDYQLGYNTRSDGSTAPEYGNEHYEDAHVCLIQFARSSDRKWLDYAAGAARHHYDLDVMHTANPARYPGFPAGKIHWHGLGTHEGSSIETGHVVPGGLDEYYLITGDPRSLEVIREQGDWVEHWARNGDGRIAPENSSDPVGLDEYERPTAWTLYTVLKSYEATGDPKYWEAASILVKNTIDWWKMPQDHIVFDPNVPIDLSKSPQSQAIYYQRSDWTQGTGYPIPTLRVDNCASTSAPYNNYAYQTHVPIAWMSGLLQTALIRYYQDLERRGGAYNATVSYRGANTPVSVDLPIMREMLIQILNMVIEHDYAGAPKYPSKYPWLANLSLNHFVYSVCPERDPNNDVGGEYLQWPLTFVSSFNAADVGSRWQTNWSAMQAKWLDIAVGQFKHFVIDDLPASPGYNGAPHLWNEPFAIARMEALGLLNNLGTAPPPSSGGGTGGTTTPPPTGGSTGGTTTPPPTSNSSLPAYRVTIGDGNPFITTPLIDLVMSVPPAAVQMNVSTTGFGQGTWTTTGEVHGFQLSSTPGTKTVYIQFRDAGNAVLASIVKSVVLLQPGFSGDVDLVLNDVADAFVYSNEPATNFGNWPTDQAGLAEVGYDYWTLMRFALPTVPGGVQATVKDAKLNIFLTENTRNASEVITPYEPTAVWNEDTVTWETRPPLASTPIGTGLSFTGRGEINQWKVFQLDSTHIQSWLQNPANTYGVALKGDGTPSMTKIETVSSEAFNSTEDRRPNLALKLTISFNDTTAPVISNLQAVNATNNSVVIQWMTNEAADGVIDYGTSTSYGSTLPQANLVTVHSALLSGLTANTAYHVRVTSKDASNNAAVSADLAFSTTNSTMVGDLTGDGLRTNNDVLALAGEILGLSPETLATADVNADGRISVADLQALINLL